MRLCGAKTRVAASKTAMFCGASGQDKWWAFSGNCWGYWRCRPRVSESEFSGSISLQTVSFLAHTHSIAKLHLCQGIYRVWLVMKLCRPNANSVSNDFLFILAIQQGVCYGSLLTTWWLEFLESQIYIRSSSFIHLLNNQYQLQPMPHMCALTFVSHKRNPLPPKCWNQSLHKKLYPGLCVWLTDVKTQKPRVSFLWKRTPFPASDKTWGLSARVS